MRRGQPQIEVTFDIDANGILHVHAQEKSTGKEQKVTIQGATNLSDDEIEAAKADAQKFAEEDKKKREMIESKNRLDAVIYQLENMKKDNADKIPEDEKKKIDEMIDEANKLKSDEGATKEQIDAEIEKYGKEIETLMSKYNAADTTQKADPDDIIEGDAEVVDADKDNR